MQQRPQLRQPQLTHIMPIEEDIITEASKAPMTIASTGNIIRIGRNTQLGISTLNNNSNSSILVDTEVMKAGPAAEADMIQMLLHKEVVEEPTTHILDINKNKTRLLL